MTTIANDPAIHGRFTFRRPPCKSTNTLADSKNDDLTAYMIEPSAQGLLPFKNLFRRKWVLLAFVCYTGFIVVIYFASPDLASKLFAGLISTIFTVLILNQLIRAEQEKSKAPIREVLNRQIYHCLFGILIEAGYVLSGVADSTTLEHEGYLCEGILRIRSELNSLIQIGSADIPDDFKEGLLQFEGQVLDFAESAAPTDYIVSADRILKLARIVFDRIVDDEQMAKHSKWLLENFEDHLKKADESNRR